TCHQPDGASIVQWTVNPPVAAGASRVERITRSIRLSGCAWLYRTTLSPAKVPIPAPSATSLAQCALLYMRESPTSVAPPYIAGATSHVPFGHQRRDSLVTAAAAANAAVVCPDG